MAVNGTAVATEMLGDALDRTVSARQQHAHEHGDPGIPSVELFLEHFDASFQETGQFGRGRRNAPFEVAGRADDAVKVGVKHQLAAEELPMKPPAARRSVREMNLQRLPVAGAENTDRAVDGPHRQFGRLTQRAATQQESDRDDIVLSSNHQPHAFVVDVDEPRQGLNRRADRGLLADQQGQRPESGAVAVFGEPQAEGLDPGFFRR